MAIRNTWRPGEHLAICDEDGFAYYASEMTTDWDGSFRHRDNLDGRHPQMDVKARNDPQALKDIRPRADADTGGDFLVQEDGMFKIILEDSSGAASDFLICETITVR
jgi:hypothetical protein